MTVQPESSVPSLGGAALLERFERCELLPSQFHHAQHIEVAWLLLRRYPLLEAMSRMATGIERLATALGVPDKFHATITCAFVLLVAERMQRDQSWPAFATDHAELFEWPSPLLSRLYTDETLWSARARSQFVLPDSTPGFTTSS